MSSNNTKILIYANAANAARLVGTSLAMDAVHKAQHTAALKTPVEIFDSYSDRLTNDGKLFENTVVLRTDDGTEIEILDAIVDITKNKKIVETALVNRAGQVKENIQQEDYTVIIKGSLFNEKDRFPYEKLYQLNKILSEARSINVASVYTCIFDIEKLVFKNGTFNQSSWQYFNVMPFTLTFSSDTEYDFLVNE
ncbi:MAG: DUF6046 domain-containing protein [Prevotellaceae bacterium]|jgi:hypothetical protein|nr:DUF6046 domain-containing protein [Prevotellaceae bacterium]